MAKKTNRARVVLERRKTSTNFKESIWWEDLFLLCKKTAHAFWTGERRVSETALEKQKKRLLAFPMQS